jgi:hypothetical protein
VFVCSCFALYPTFWVISPDVLRLLPPFVRVPTDTGAKHTKGLGFPRNRAQNKQLIHFLASRSDGILPFLGISDDGRMPSLLVSLFKLGPQL